MAANAQVIVRSYRSIYRHGLQAVQYATPARHVLKGELRHAYRNGIAADLNMEKLENTINFLINATKEKGSAHKILKNLLYVWWWREKNARPVTRVGKLNSTPAQMHIDAFQHFDITLKMLNETMGLCLPVRDFQRATGSHLGGRPTNADTKWQGQHLKPTQRSSR